MKLLTLLLGMLMTTFVALLYAYSYFTAPPSATAAHPPVVPDVPYTADAKVPPVGTGPRYTVTLSTSRTLTWLNRSQEAPPGIALPNPHFPSLPDYQAVQPLAINHHHQEVGFYRGGGSGAYLVILARPFLLQNGHLHFLSTLPLYQITHPTDLNDSGKIVGDALVDSHPSDMDAPTHAVCWLHGEVHDLGTGAASGINDAGDIVGDSGAGQGDFSYAAHALLWQHGYRYDLNACLLSHSGWVLTSADAINNRGQIVGQGLFHGRTQAFLLTPH